MQPLTQSGRAHRMEPKTQRGDKGTSGGDVPQKDVQGRPGQATLPLVLPSSFVKDVVLSVDRKDAVLERALPVKGLSDRPRNLPDG